MISRNALVSSQFSQDSPIPTVQLIEGNRSNTVQHETPVTQLPLQAPKVTHSLCSDVPLGIDLVDQVDVMDTLAAALKPSPAVPLLTPNKLQKTFFCFKHGDKYKLFTDRKLPPNKFQFLQNERFDTNYFVTLCNLVSAGGLSWPPGTPNHLGARVQLVHSDLHLDRWRHHLVGYNDIELCQYLEYGFPLGLYEDPPPDLDPVLSNHGSAYSYYPWIDKFVASSLVRKYLAGPFSSQPFNVIHLSPLMTAVKKPDSRRPVFVASFSDNSLNKATPTDVYLGQQIEYSYPKVEDFRRLVLTCGKGSYMWKRDLSSFFLQVPLDPIDYPKVAFIWRGFLFFFIGLMFGLRNSGLQGQRVTTAVTWIHQRLGLESVKGALFNSINYSDDIGGVESTMECALMSSNTLSELLVDLGLKESLDKYHSPSTCMPYLGIEFDSVKLEMRVTPEKIAEIRDDLNLWEKKSTATKKTLQQLLGKLFWISRCVRFSRPFMGRLLQLLRTMYNLPDNKKVSLDKESKRDITWWSRYLRRFNGVEIMYPDDPLDLTLEQLLDTSAKVNCGDAQPWGGGAYYEDEYWSRSFPTWLRDPGIPIHIKEFFVILVSCWLWGDKWTGCLVYIFCDNDAVCDALEKERPKDEKMQEMLREFLYIVCLKKFTPVVRKISSKGNEVADFISRCHDQGSTEKFFRNKNLPLRNFVNVPDNFFSLNSNW